MKSKKRNNKKGTRRNSTIQIRYQVKTYDSIWITRKYHSVTEFMWNISFDRGVFKYCEHRRMTKKDFVFVEVL